MKKQALIIGGTTGMGKATTELLINDDVELIVVGRPGKNLESIEKELSSIGSIKR